MPAVFCCEPSSFASCLTADGSEGCNETIPVAPGPFSCELTISIAWLVSEDLAEGAAGALGFFCCRAAVCGVLFAGGVCEGVALGEVRPGLLRVEGVVAVVGFGAATAVLDAVPCLWFSRGREDEG